MPSRLPALAPCHHELRPGTKVCLHCRRAEREATAARHRVVLVRVGLVAAAIGAVVFAGVSGLAAWKNPDGSGLGQLMGTPGSLEAAPVATSSLTATPLQARAATPGTASASTPVDTAGLRALASADSAKAAAAAAAVARPAPIQASQPVLPAATPAALPPSAPLHPIVGEGRTELQNGIYALRSGDTVTVHFDTPEARTRRPEKLEQIVRATLPQVHGRAADELLAGVASGTLIPSGELTADQPLRAISLRGPNGQMLSVSPQTRPGRDGPLVVSYRVTPAR